MKEFKDYFSKSEIVLGSVKEFSQNGLQGSCQDFFAL